MPKHIATDKSARPKRRRLRRAAKWFGCGSVLFLVFLFWPVSPPASSLLARMPADMSFGGEIRSGTALWSSSAVFRKQLAHTPLGRFLAPLFAQEGLELRSLLSGMNDQVDAALERPLGLGLVGRSLNGAVAIATTDTRFKDAALLAKVDNAGMALMRLLLITRGKNDQGLPSHLCEKKGTREWYITISHSLLVAATSRNRLLDMIQNLESNSRLFATPVPAEGIVVYCNPNDTFREATGRRIGVEAWSFDQGVMALTCDSSGLHFAGNGVFDPERLKMKSSMTGVSTTIAFAPPETATAWCTGYLDPRFSFDALSHFLWEGAPQRAVAQPGTVLAWEALNDGIIKYADGTMLLAVLPPPPRLRITFQYLRYRR